MPMNTTRPWTLVQTMRKSMAWHGNDEHSTAAVVKLCGSVTFAQLMLQ